MILNKLDFQMNNYRLSMNKLISEKEGTTLEILNKKTEKAKKIASQVFLIEGEGEFQETMTQSIDKICQTKPGRNLMKVFSEYSDKIIIKEGKKSCVKNEIIYINIDEETSYNSIINNNEKISLMQPFEITLAHEMIHAMHGVKNKTECDNNNANSLSVIQNTDNREEQDTIFGINIDRFLNSNIKINKYDILSENAFLLSLNYLPRIDHRPGTNTVVENNLNKDKLGNYYIWLENEIKKLIIIPQEIIDDEQAILDYLSKNPFASDSIPEKFKTHDFFVKIYHINNQIIPYSFPFLQLDKQFLRKLMGPCSVGSLLVHPDLLKEKEFALEVIENTPKLCRAEIFDKLEEELKNDPEIITCMNKESNSFLDLYI